MVQYELSLRRKYMAEKSEQNKDSDQGGFVKNWVIPFLVAIVLTIFIRTFIFQTTLVDGLSMYPTLDDGDMLIATKIPYYFNDTKPGDIIIFESPINSDEIFIKRVIGLEGDDIRISNGHFYVNGKKLEEDYLPDDVQTYAAYDKESSWKLEEDQVFAVGDNRSNSTDSRIFGPIEKDSIEAKAVFRIWPLSKFGVVD